jgi:hypothetical protein
MTTRVDAAMIATSRARQVGELPHIKAWVRRFERLAKSMPPEVLVFVASGKPCVLALSKSGERYMAHDFGGYSQDAKVASVAGGLWDGGDW